MEGGTISRYLEEFARVLRPGGRAVIHHAGRRHGSLPLGFLRHLGAPGRWLYRIPSLGWNTRGDRDGDRGNVSRELVRDLAERAGLAVVVQTDHWGDVGQYDCRRFQDVISVLARKP